MLRNKTKPEYKSNIIMFDLFSLGNIFINESLEN